MNALATPSPTRRAWRPRSRTARGARRTPGHDSNERLEFLGRRRARPGRDRPLFRTYPELPEGELAKVRASVVNAGGAGRGRGRARPRRRAAARQGRGRVGRAARSRRSWPTPWRRSSAPSTSTAAGTRRSELVHAPARRAHRRGGDRPGRPGLQDAAAGAGGPALRPTAALRGAPTTAPTTPSASSPTCYSAASRTGAGEGRRRSRPSRPRPRPAWERLQASTTRLPTGAEPTEVGADA